MELRSKPRRSERRTVGRDQYQLLQNDFPAGASMGAPIFLPGLRDFAGYFIPMLAMKQRSTSKLWKADGMSA